MKIKKGFTIIEILAVIVIIAVITSIAVPAIFKVTNNSKKNLYCSKLEIVQKSAERYADDNSLLDTCEIDNEEYNCEEITIQNLLNDSYIDPDGLDGAFIDPRNQLAINTMNILVYSKNDRSYAYIEESECPKFVTSALSPNNLSNVKHIVTFALNGGVWNGTSPVTLKEGSTLYVNNPTKAGYAFTGWTISGVGSSMNGTTFTMGSANATLTAQWTVNNYVLTVNANGGTWSGTTPQTIAYQGTATINNPTRTGYTFTGWTVTGTGSSIAGTTFTMGLADTVLTANWTPTNYTLTVLTNGGTWSGTTPQTIAYQGTATINNPTKANYAFTGWTVSGTGSTIVGTTFTMGSANTSLTANWLLTGYTLTVNASGGTWSGTSPQTLSTGETSTIANPTRTGYIFMGWTVSGAGSTLNGTTFTMGSANATITANWLAYSSMYTYTGNSTVIDDGNGNWRIKFLTSGTLTPNINMTTDIFLVGGGGGGRKYNSYTGGGGGGGGRTLTVSSVTLYANNTYSVTVGDGGIFNANGSPSSIVGTGVNSSAPGGDGATTSNGGAGGSGGGAGGVSKSNNGVSGGSNGSNGSSINGYQYGGTGQGSTTYEFGDSSLTLYAGGGGGGAYYKAGSGGSGGAGGGGAGGNYKGSGVAGAVNTGGGGGGPGGQDADRGGSGGSGIVIIRNHR